MKETVLKLETCCQGTSGLWKLQTLVQIYNNYIIIIAAKSSRVLHVIENQYHTK